MYSASGMFSSPDFDETGYIRCFESKQVQTTANSIYPDQDQLFLIVIDPLRIQHPIKREKTEEGQFLNVYGCFSIDAVIDRILLKRNKNGEFSVHIKHFD